MKETYDFLNKCKIFYLATIDGNNPRVRPFGAINIFEDKLYIQTGKIKDVSHQMEKNPNIEICGFIDGKWIRIEAKAIRDDRYEAKADMLNNNPKLKSMYSASDDNTEVLYLKDAISRFYSFTEETKIISF